MISFPGREGDHVRSPREQVNEWPLPRGLRFRDDGSADPTGTAEKELIDVKGFSYCHIRNVGANLFLSKSLGKVQN